MHGCNIPTVLDLDVDIVGGLGKMGVNVHVISKEKKRFQLLTKLFVIQCWLCKETLGKSTRYVAGHQVENIDKEYEKHYWHW